MKFFSKFFTSKNNRFDWLLLVAVFLLILLGLAIQYSLGLGDQNFSIVTRQAIFAGVGLALFFAVALTNYRNFAKLAYYIYIFSLVLLLITLIFGSVVRGTRGWFLGFQVVEFAKLALILVLARFWGDNLERFPKNKHILLSLGLMVAPVVLILLQPDFGSAFILILIGVGTILIVDRGGKRSLLIGLVGILILISSWMFLFKPYQKDRILNFVNPQRDPFGSGYQVTQSMIAVGSGRFLGRGFGLGSQSQLKFLPEAETDFVFSVMSEEFGFLVSGIALLLYVLIFWRMTKICLKAYDDFSLIAVFGVAIFFISQVLINVGMNLGLMPITGITLPLLSYGGSSLIVSLLALGFVESVWRYQVKGTK